MLSEPVEKFSRQKSAKVVNRKEVNALNLSLS